jgi:hypothetical protein
MAKSIVKMRMISGEKRQFTKEARDAALDRTKEGLVFLCYKNRVNQASWHRLL